MCTLQMTLYVAQLVAHLITACNSLLAGVAAHNIARLQQAKNNAAKVVCLFKLKAHALNNTQTFWFRSRFSWFRILQSRF